MGVESWVDVADAADLDSAGKLRAHVGASAVFVVRAEEHLFAISNACTHQGAPLDKGVVKIAGSQRTVTCPAHGSMFDLGTGRVMRPPAAKPAQVYDVKVENGRVFVRPRAGS